ncbi:MAG: hypothetical protein AB7H93_09955 [Vicinamibacterales bacterium]
MRLHGFGRTMVATLALLAALGVGAPRLAAAQAAGDPVPFMVTSGTGVVIVGTIGCDGYVAQALGGITLFGSLSPSGPYVGVLPQRAGPNGEGQPECPLFIIPGVPPGTYWVTVVYGFVSTENVPVEAWKSVTVAGGCTRAPSPPVLLPGQPVIVGQSVSVAFASPPDCAANEMVLDVGTTPFTIDIPPITVGSLAFEVNNVPAGTYYLRARSRNAYGESKRSTVVPVSVPGGCGGATPQAPLNPAVTVNGNVVTLSWSQSPGLISPATFYVISIKNPSSGLTVDNLVIPATTSISAPLPAGSYRVGIASGNACGTTTPNTGDLIFTVP